MVLVAQAVYWMGRIFDYALLARAILSWVVGMRMTNNDTVVRIYDALIRFTEPIVSPVRNLINRFFRTSMIDLSVFATMILVGLAVRVIVQVLLMLA
ncbi:MAG: YggT family protein [Firmicutes bacterium]|nr:YggT family protein [Bacillota bacterium]